MRATIENPVYAEPKKPANVILSTVTVVGWDREREEIREVCNAVFSTSKTGANVYASLHGVSIDYNNGFLGYGKAGGGGYHRESAALQQAAENAGVILSEDISGLGESAVHEAMIAIARALGYGDAVRVVNHYL